MKVRTKFTLWISLASMAAALFFSILVLSETKGHFAEATDFELADIAEAVFTNLASTASIKEQTPHIQPRTINYPVSRFWLRVTDSSDNIIYASKLAKLADIPPAKDNHSYTVTSDIAHEHIWIPPEEREEMEGISGDSVKLQARFFTRIIEGQQYSIHIAKPLLLLTAEFNELFHELAIGMIGTILLIVLVAYFVAGRILSPLVSINNMIQLIRESSLNKRIPLGKSKDELYRLTSSLNSMFDRLEQSFQRQKDFVSNASHEMKSPLTILMLGHEEMLSGNLPKEIRTDLEKQLFSMRRLNKLIRDLLSIARLEQQESLLREPVNLDELIHGILEDYEAILSAKKIKVTTQIPSLVFSADHEKLHRLFINLIDNAIKYNREINGQLDIQAKQKNASILITVTNSGTTIPAEDMPKIFNQFYRVEKSRAQAYGGTGLGLTIAKRIVEMHGGSLEITSAEDTTTFLITLPNIADY